MKNIFKITTLLIILNFFLSCTAPTQVPNEYVGNWHGNCSWAMPDQNGNPVIVKSENTNLQINADYTFTGTIGNMNISGTINTNTGSVGGSGIQGDSTFEGYSVIHQCYVFGKISATIEYLSSGNYGLDGNIQISSSNPNNFPYISGELFLTK